MFLFTEGKFLYKKTLQKFAKVKKKNKIKQTKEYDPPQYKNFYSFIKENDQKNCYLYDGFWTYSFF